MYVWIVFVLIVIVWQQFSSSHILTVVCKLLHKYKWKFFLFSYYKHYLAYLFPDVSFNRCVYEVPGGVFLYTSFIHDCVNVDVDDDIVGSEFKWPTLIRDSALKRLYLPYCMYNNWMNLRYILYSRASIAKNV